MDLPRQWLIPPTAQDIRQAAERLRGRVTDTPVLTSGTLDDLAGARLAFKCEQLQKTGAFKYRGASHALLTLPADRATRGVATHSSGNHGAALACAARSAGVPAFIVVPSNVSPAKLANIKRYGGVVRLCTPTLAAREITLNEVVAETGATFVHPYDNTAVIAGQGTATLELIERAGPLDAVVTPVGGGGLLAGAALAAGPGVEVYGAEPLGADDAARSFAAGSRVAEQTPETICDGLRTLLGELNFDVIARRCTAILTVSDAEVIEAMQLVWSILKQLIEPSAAVSLAAVLKERERFAGRRVGIVLSGGNADPAALAGLAGASG